MEKQIKPCPFCGCIPEVKGDVVTHRHKDDICIVDDTQYGLEEWNKRADGWISVEDRLPEKYDDYLTYDEYGIKSISHYNMQGWCSKNGKIEYWAYLLEVPK